MAKSGFFLVDNSNLKSKANGLAYRLSKVFSDAHPDENVYAPWGQIVHGNFNSDGWLCVDHQKIGLRLYLPFEVRGITVLQPHKIAHREGITGSTGPAITSSHASKTASPSVDASRSPKPNQVGKSQLDNFKKGSWDYIVVGKGASIFPDPVNTFDVRFGYLATGEKVEVCQRGVLNEVMWLKLANGRGWVAERQPGLMMSEIHYEVAEPEYSKRNLIVDPRFRFALSMYGTPLDHEKTVCGDLFPGTFVAIDTQARVLTPLSNGNESWRVFLNVTAGKKMGWMAPFAGSTMDRAFVECERSEPSLHASSSSSGPPQQLPSKGTKWVIVKEHDLPIYEYPAVHSSTKRYASLDERLEITETVRCCGLVFHRLQFGGWIRGSDAKNSKVGFVMDTSNRNDNLLTLDNPWAGIQSQIASQVAAQTDEHDRNRQGVTKQPNATHLPKAALPTIQEDSVEKNERDVGIVRKPELKEQPGSAYLKALHAPFAASLSCRSLVQKTSHQNAVGQDFGLYRPS